MYKRAARAATHHIGVCTNTMCGLLGGDAVYDAVSERARRRARRDHAPTGSSTLERHRVPGGVHARAGDDRRLGVLRPDHARRRDRGRRPAGGRRGGPLHPRPGGPGLPARVERTIAGIDDDGLADEGGERRRADARRPARGAKEASRRHRAAASEPRTGEVRLMTADPGPHRPLGRAGLLHDRRLPRHGGYRALAAGASRWTRTRSSRWSRTPACAVAAARASPPA